MNKLVIVTVFIAVLTLGAESFRVPREIAEEEQKGPISVLTDQVKSYYDYSVNTASSYLESIKGLQLEEKAKNLYKETTGAVRTYFGIVQDQLYHIIYPSENA